MTAGQKCSESDIKTFQCSSGFFGGYNNVTSQHYCNSRHSVKDSWFPAMCIVSENSAFLGYFYYAVDFLKSVSGYISDYSYRLLVVAVLFYFIVHFIFDIANCLLCILYRVFIVT